MVNFDREDIKIDVIVSETDRLCAFSGDFFDPADAEDMLEFVKKCGYRSEIIRTEQRFSNAWHPYRKIVHRDIDWSDPRVIYNVIKWRKENKSYEEIAELLHSEGTGFAILIRGSKIWEAYNQWRDAFVGEITDKQLMEFCNSFVRNRRE